jgi:hypothetical protein
MNHIYNPMLVLRGVFIPLWLLVRPEVEHGAKLVYSLLAQRVNPKGVSRIYVPALATELGDEESAITNHISELESYRLIEIRKQHTDPDVLQCIFREHFWMGLVQHHNGNGEQSSKAHGPKSRHSREACLRYAKAKQNAGEEIRNVYALATHFYKTGDQDEEIGIFLRQD